MQEYWGTGITPAEACGVPHNHFARSSSTKTSVFAEIADFPLVPPVAYHGCSLCSSIHDK